MVNVHCGTESPYIGLFMLSDTNTGLENMKSQKKGKSILNK